MEGSTSKEKILKKVRNALVYRSEAPYPNTDQEQPVFKDLEDPVDINFAQELNKAGGFFIYCETEREFTEKLRQLMSENEWAALYHQDEYLSISLTNASIPCSELKTDPEGEIVGITRCEFLIARLGGIMVSSRSTSRRMHVFPDIHIVVGFTSQLVTDLKDAFAGIRKKYEPEMPSFISVITGPSRTADIEKTLVMGAHGPKELYVFLIEDRY